MTEEGDLAVMSADRWIEFLHRNNRYRTGGRHLEAWSRRQRRWITVAHPSFALSQARFAALDERTSNA